MHDFRLLSVQQNGNEAHAVFPARMLTDEEYTATLGEDFRQLGEMEIEQVRLDLRQVKHLEDWFFPFLLALWRALRTRSRRLTIDASDEITEFFQVVGLDQVFEVNSNRS